MNNSMKDSDGIKIRRQYFNYFICVLLLIVLFFLIIRTVSLIAHGYFSFYEWWQNMKEVLLPAVGVLLVLSVLSVLNAFFFGDIVCVMNEDGIRYADVFIRWEDVLYFEYNVMEHSRRHYIPAFITVVCREEKLSITSAPFFACFVAKKYKPSLVIRLNKSVFLYVAIPIACAVIFLIKFVL